MGFIDKTDKVLNWVWKAAIAIGAILLFIFLTKDDTDKKLDELNGKIKDVEKDIKKTQREKKKLVDSADDHAEAGAKLDKQIEVAKKKQKNLAEKRKAMKTIFDKYGSKANGQ